MCVLSSDSNCYLSTAELILHEKMAEVRPDVGLPRQLTSSSTSSDTTHISNSNGDSAHSTHVVADTGIRSCC